MKVIKSIRLHSILLWLQVFAFANSSDKTPSFDDLWELGNVFRGPESSSFELESFRLPTSKAAGEIGEKHLAPKHLESLTFVCDSNTLPACSDHTTRICDETKNNDGNTKCSSDLDCIAGRSCSSEGQCTGSKELILVECPENSFCIGTPFIACSHHISRYCDEGTNAEGPGKCLTDEDCLSGRTCNGSGFCEGVADVRQVDCHALVAASTSFADQIPSTYSCTDLVTGLSTWLQEVRATEETSNVILDGVRSNTSTSDITPEDNDVVAAFNNLSVQEYPGVHSALASLQELTPEACSSLKIEIAKLLKYLGNSKNAQGPATTVEQPAPAETQATPQNTLASTEEVKVTTETETSSPEQQPAIDSQQNAVVSETQQTTTETKEQPATVLSESTTSAKPEEEPVQTLSPKENPSEVSGQTIVVVQSGNETAIGPQSSNFDVVEQPYLTKNEFNTTSSTTSETSNVSESTTAAENNQTVTTTIDNNPPSATESETNNTNLENETGEEALQNPDQKSIEQSQEEQKSTEQPKQTPVVITLENTPAQNQTTETSPTSGQQNEEQTTSLLPSPSPAETKQQVGSFNETESQAISEEQAQPLVVSNTEVNENSEPEKQSTDQNQTTVQQEGENGVQIVPLNAPEEQPKTENLSTESTETSTTTEQLPPKDQPVLVQQNVKSSILSVSQALENEPAQNADENEAYRLVLQAMKTPLVSVEGSVEPSLPPAPTTKPGLNNAVLKILQLSNEFSSKINSSLHSDGKTINELIEDITLDFFGGVWSVLPPTDYPTAVKAEPIVVLPEQSVKNSSQTEIISEGAISSNSTSQGSQETLNVQAVVPETTEQQNKVVENPEQINQTDASNQQTDSTNTESDEINLTTIVSNPTVDQIYPKTEASTDASQINNPVESEQATPQQSNIEEQTTPPQSNIEEQTTPQQSNIEEQTTPQQSNIEEQTTPQQSNIEEQTTPQQSNIEEQVITNTSDSSLPAENSSQKEASSSEISGLEQQNQIQQNEVSDNQETTNSSTDNNQTIEPIGEKVSSGDAEQLQSDSTNNNESSTKNDQANELSAPAARLLAILKLYKEHVNHRNSNAVFDYKHYGHLKDFHKHLECLLDEGCNFQNHLKAAEGEYNRLNSESIKIQNSSIHKQRAERGLLSKAWCSVRGFFGIPCHDLSISLADEQPIQLGFHQVPEKSITQDSAKNVQGNDSAIQQMNAEKFEHKQMDSGSSDLNSAVDSSKNDHVEIIADQPASITENTQELQNLLRSFVEKIPDCLTNDDIKSASHDFVENAHEWLGQGEEHFPETAEFVQSVIQNVRQGVEAGKTISPGQVKNILAVWEREAKQKIDSQFTTDGLLGQTEKLKSFKNALSEAQIKLHAFVPVGSVLDSQLAALVQKLESQIAIFTNAKDATPEQLSAARQYLKDDIKANIEGIDATTSAQLLNSLSNNLDGALHSNFGKSLNADNLQFIVHRVVQSFHANLDQLQDPGKKSDFVLDVSDLDYLTDNVIDELKKSEAAHQPAIVDLRDIEKTLDETNKRIDFSINTGDKARDAAELLVKYQDGLHSVLASDEFYTQLKNYIGKYYEVLKAHAQPWQPLVVYSEAYKTLTGELGNPNAVVEFPPLPPSEISLVPEQAVVYETKAFLPLEIKSIVSPNTVQAEEQPANPENVPQEIGEKSEVESAQNETPVSSVTEAGPSNEVVVSEEAKPEEAIPVKDEQSESPVQQPESNEIEAPQNKEEAPEEVVIPSSTEQTISEEPIQQSPSDEQPQVSAIDEQNQPNQEEPQKTSTEEQPQQVQPEESTQPAVVEQQPQPAAFENQNQSEEPVQPAAVEEQAKTNASDASDQPVQPPAETDKKTEGTGEQTGSEEDQMGFEAVRLLRASVYHQIQKLDKLSSQDRQFFDFYNRLMLEWAYTKDINAFTRKLDKIIRALQGRPVVVRNLQVANIDPRHKFMDKLTQVKDSLTGIVRNLDQTFDLASQLSGTISEGQSFAQQAKEFFALKNPILSSQPGQSSSGVWGKVTGLFGSKRQLERHYGVAETFDSLKNLYADLEKAHQSAEELKSNLEVAKRFANGVQTALNLANKHRA